MDDYFTGKIEINAKNPLLYMLGIEYSYNDNKSL